MAAPGSDDSLDPRDARIAELEEELTAKTTEFEAVIAKLVTQVEDLTEKLNRNSRNSHLPPSSDGPGSSAKGKGGSKKSKSGRKRGGQKGRRGAHRTLRPPEDVNAFVHLFPEACTGCGASLPKVQDVDARRYQVLELVAGGRHLTEFRRHEVQCACGCRTRAEYDPKVIPQSPFGPQLTARIVMFTGTYHLSRENTRQVMRELFDIRISVGTISAMEARFALALKPAYEEAERAVQDADVKYSDGTSWLRAGATKSLWTLASATVVVYKIFANGQRDTIRSMFGALKGILISDRATVFGFWAMKFRQICWAHLLRKFVSFSERDGPAGAIGRELLGYTALVFEYWHGFKAGQLTRGELREWMRPVQLRFEAALQRAVDAGIKRLSGSCADMLAHGDALWTFVTHVGVEPTNNAAERALRPFVLWRKRSFGSQSDRGEQFAERMMTVVQTLRRQGKGVLDFLVRSMTAHVQGTPAPALVGA